MEYSRQPPHTPDKHAGIADSIEVGARTVAALGVGLVGLCVGELDFLTPNPQERGFISRTNHSVATWLMVKAADIFDNA